MVSNIKNTRKKRWLQYYKPLIDEFIKVGIYKEPIDSEIKDDFICIEVLEISYVILCVKYYWSQN